MSDWHRNELERRFLGVVERLAFRFLSRREDELERRDEMILRIRALFALERLGALPMSAITRHLDCTHSSTKSAMYGLERGQMVQSSMDPADPDLWIFDLSSRGRAVADRLRYLLAERGIEESDHWESMRSDEVDAALRMIQSFGNELGKLEVKAGTVERNGH